MKLTLLIGRESTQSIDRQCQDTNGIGFPTPLLSETSLSHIHKLIITDAPMVVVIDPGYREE
jgi:hypothetical protein